jgi:hypothetical protein
LFDNFNSHINWKDVDEEEDEATKMVRFHALVEGHNQFSNGHSWADEGYAYRRQ